MATKTATLPGPPGGSAATAAAGSVLHDDATRTLPLVLRDADALPQIPGHTDPAAMAHEGWLWYEAVVVAPSGKPLVSEPCLLFDGQGRIVDRGTTDRNGRVRFWELPLKVAPSTHLVPAQAQKPVSEAVRSARERLNAVIDDTRFMVLPYVLESFATPGAQSSPARWGKNDGKYDDARRGDAWFHALAPFQTNVAVRIANLTPEEKFNYFVWSYEDNGVNYRGRPVYFATINTGVTGEPRTMERRWRLAQAGTSCNAHVNFFLGYWFNYNSGFTGGGSRSAMSYLPVLDCTTAPFLYTDGVLEHRGYREFVEPVTGEFGGYQDRTGFPSRDPKKVPFAELYVHYLRMSQFFEWETGKPTAKFNALVNALGDFNIYSLSNFTDDDPTRKEQLDKAKTLEGDKDGPAKFRKWLDETTHYRRNTAASLVKAWLKMHRKTTPICDYPTNVVRAAKADGKAKPKGKAPPPPVVTVKDLTDAEIDAFDRNTEVIWHIIWTLDESRECDIELLPKLKKLLNKDHHGGILVKRDPKGNRPIPGATPELWKFSADGPPDGTPIRKKKYTDLYLSKASMKSFIHLGIWKLKTLEPGGFAIRDDATQEVPLLTQVTYNERTHPVDLDAPPRFIDVYSDTPKAATATAAKK